MQIRGNCQCCGKQQAIVNGFMSKHGYTVNHGWFSGVCSGRNFAPLQISRKHTDDLIVQIINEIPELLAKADKVKLGEILPEFCEIRKGFGKREKISFSDATAKQKYDARNSMEWDLRNRAYAGKNFITEMSELANKFYQTELIAVEKN